MPNNRVEFARMTRETRALEGRRWALQGISMKGVIKHINSARGMVAVLTKDGSYSVFELLGRDSVEIGDLVSWKNDTGLGGEEITNHTQGERLEVFFQNHYVHPDQLRQQLLYP